MSENDFSNINLNVPDDGAPLELESGTKSNGGSRCEITLMDPGTQNELNTWVTELEGLLDVPMTSVCQDLCLVSSLLRLVENMSSRYSGNIVNGVLLDEMKYMIECVFPLAKPNLPRPYPESLDSFLQCFQELLDNQQDGKHTKHLEKEMKFCEASGTIRIYAEEAMCTLLEAAYPNLKQDRKHRSILLTHNLRAMSAISLSVLGVVGIGCQATQSLPGVIGYSLCSSCAIAAAVVCVVAPRGEKYCTLALDSLVTISPILVYLFDTPSHYSGLVLPFLAFALQRSDIRFVLYYAILWTISTVISVALEWNTMTFMMLYPVWCGVAWYEVKKRVERTNVDSELRVKHYRRLLESFCSLDTPLSSNQSMRMDRQSSATNSKQHSLPPSLNSSAIEPPMETKAVKPPVRLPVPTAPEPHDLSSRSSAASSQESVVDSKQVTEAPVVSTPPKANGDYRTALLVDGQGGPEYVFSMETVHKYLNFVATTKEGIVLLWNEKMVKTTGFSIADAMGQKLNALLTTDTWEELSAHEISSKVISFQKKGCSTGTPVECTAVQLYHGPHHAGTLLVGVNVDAQQSRQNVSEWFACKIINQLELTKEAVMKGEQGPAVSSITGALSLVTRMRNSLNDEAQNMIVEVDLVQYQSRLISEYDLNPEKFTIDKDVPDCIQIDSGASLSLEQFISRFAKRARNHDSVFTVTIKKRRENGECLLQVTVVDGSPAISRKKLNAMFSGNKESDLFHAGKRVQRAGGSFTIRSKKGVGVTVFLEFPYLASEAQTAVVHDNNQRPFNTLMLETVEVYRNSFCQALWKRRHAIQQAFTLAEAIAALDQSKVEIVIVSIANRQARKRATELMSAARNQKSSMHIVLTGDSIDPEMLTRCATAGVDFLRTPFLQTELSTIMSKIEAKVLKERKEAEIKKNIARVIGEKKNCPWVKGRQLGAGAAGTVYEATFELTGGVMAVKIIQLRGMKDEDLVPYLAEIELLSQLDHENIINYFYSTRTDTELQVFMEYAAEGCLQRLLREGPLDPPLAAAFMKDILKGMEYLHSNDVIHRDLKCANILLSSGFIAKVADFGCASNIAQIQDGIAGTPAFMAPELLDGQRATRASDIWALGCTLWEMLSGHLPFPEYNGLIALTGFLSDPARTDADILAKVPDFGFPAANDFIACCLKLDPTKRLSCTELLKHEFISCSKKEIAFDEQGSDYGSEMKLDSNMSITIPSSPKSLNVPSANRRQSNTGKLVRRSVSTKGLSEAALQQLEKIEDRKKSVNNFFEDDDSDGGDSVASDASVNTVNFRM